jgi:hypothetical protein
LTTIVRQADINGNADRKVDRLADKYTVRGRWADNRLKKQGQV